ncbi:MAG: PilZ domain-containing protein [Planctomycetota bacterium]
MVAALKFPPIGRRSDNESATDLRESDSLPLRSTPTAPGLFEGRMRDTRPASEPSQPSYMRMRRPRGSERRVFERKVASGRVSGRRTDHSVHAHKMPYLNLSLSDLSVGGMRAQSQDAVEPGEHVVVFFPPQGTQMGWDAYGRVVRCLPKGHGYEVAMEFDPLPAA